MRGPQKVGEMHVTPVYPTSPATYARHRLALIGLLVVVAVLFGLVAMHSIATTSAVAPVVGHTHAIIDDTALPPVSAGLASSEASTVPELAPVCAGACERDCLMFGGMCTVGTTAAVVTLMLYQRSSPRIVPTTLARVFVVVAQHATPLKPPSLSVLSISRT